VAVDDAIGTDRRWVCLQASIQNCWRSHGEADRQLVRAKREHAKSHTLHSVGSLAIEYSWNGGRSIICILEGIPRADERGKNFLRCYTTGTGVWDGRRPRLIAPKSTSMQRLYHGQRVSPNKIENIFHDHSHLENVASFKPSCTEFVSLKIICF